MRLLRVRIDAPWTASRAVDWVLRNERGDMLREATTASAQWPPHDRLEIVVAASQVRIVALRLPPLPAARVAPAARFAVEDEIAGAESAHVAVSSQRNGHVLAILCPPEILRSLLAPEAALTHLDRVIAEPELAEPLAEWRWCGGEHGDAFVRLPDGSAFAVTAIASGAAVPSELAVALAAARVHARPVVRAEWPASASDLARWQQDLGVRFLAGAPFHWQEAAAPEGLTDLLQGEFALRAKAPRPAARRLWTPALSLLAIAAVLQLLGTFGEWIALRLDATRTQREWQALAIAANLPRDTLTSAAAVRDALLRRQRELLHAHHRFASDDALPLLARASPAVTALPGGSLRRATFDAGHWTLELEGVSAPALADAEARLRGASLEALVVPTASGARIRIGRP